jgi:hypothetical protein
MKELKRKKRQLEHQLAEKQKQDQVVKVNSQISNYPTTFPSLGHPQYFSINRNRSSSTFYCC